MKEIAWEPSGDYLEKANIRRFMDKHGLRDYEELIARSTGDSEWFWGAVVEDLNIEFFTPFQRVLDSSRGIPWTQWYVGGQINIAHNCLDRHARSPRHRRLACISEGEDGSLRKITYAELYTNVNRLANALLRLGVKRGDSVALYMPMVPEVVVQLLACLKIGAICIPIFSGYAPPAVAERLADARVKVLFTADASWRRGRQLHIKANADQAVAAVPSVEQVVVFRRMGAQVPWSSGRDIWWHELLQGQSGECETEQMDSEDIALILYSSGTTGRPKGTVHTHAGTLVQVSKEVGYFFDLKAQDRFFWLTDIGWMMGPWMILGALHHGGCIFLYEGAPDHPGPDRLWDMIERHRITIFGLSPTAIRMLMRSGIEHIEKHDLQSLRILGSTGEPWDPDSWRWYFRQVGRERCPIINISGGTDIVGCFLAPLPICPLKPCTLGGPGLGMDVDVWDEWGRPVRGQVGYLVARKPAPSMTRGFWGDPERYLETYWSRWPDVWDHGDWALIDEDGFWFLLGRADDTIKVGGRRVGPAEIEAALIEHPAVSEAAAIGVPHEIKGEGIVCFVVLSPHFQPGERLKAELKEQVVSRQGAIHRPEEIKFVTDLPKTRTAKIVRRIIKAKYLGREDLGDLSSIENPQAIEEIARAI